MFIILLEYLVPLEEVDKYVAAHRAFLDDAYQNNLLIASGPKSPRAGGVLLSQQKDQVQLEAWLKSDPFQINGIAKYTIIEFNPTKHHADFASFIG